MADTTQFYEQYENDLELLELVTEEKKIPNLSYINKQFRKLAFTLHPDRKGGNTESMQNLTEAFQRLSNYVRENGICDKDEENINNNLREFFEKFNDIQQNINSTTIFVENELTREWESVLSSSFGPPDSIPMGKNGLSLSRIIKRLQSVYGQ